MTETTPLAADMIAMEQQTPPRESDDWVDEYLDHNRFEKIYRDLVRHAARQLSLALGPRHGQRAVAAMLKSLAGPLREGEEGAAALRRMADGDISLIDDEVFDFDWHDIAAEFAHLFAYARSGEGRYDDPAESGREIAALLAHFRQLIADLGLRAALGDQQDYVFDALVAAEARWAIDHGNAVVPEGLAALACVKPKTIANLLAAREISTDGDGRIPATEALRYLDRKKDFLRSTWQNAAAGPPPPPTDGAKPLSDQVFVPVDGEGNAFLPTLMRRGRDGVRRFIVGTKAEPVFVEDYWDALDRLARMPVPRWRRAPASGTGGWSLVTAQEGWRRFARADLKREIKAEADRRD